MTCWKEKFVFVLAGLTERDADKSITQQCTCTVCADAV